MSNEKTKPDSRAKADSSQSPCSALLFCKDCKHYRETHESCHRASEEKTTDLVTGMEKSCSNETYSCERERVKIGWVNRVFGGCQMCGVEAIHFKRKSV